MIVRKLYVPANVRLQNEVIKGLSVPDAIKTVVATMAAAGIAVLLGLVFGVSQLWCVLFVFLVAGLCVAVLSKFDTNLSMVDYIRISIKYAREQKRFYYRYRRD